MTEIRKEKLLNTDLLKKELEDNENWTSKIKIRDPRDKIQIKLITYLYINTNQLENKVFKKTPLTTGRKTAKHLGRGKIYMKTSVKCY